MSPRAGGRGAALVAWVTRHARPVVLASLALAVLAGLYAAFNLRIDTSTTDMIAADVPFRRHAVLFEQAFPQFDKPLVALIEASTPEQAETGALALAERLRARPELFDAVEYLPAEPFFRRYGLLFLETAELERLSERLAGAQPLLAVLAADPTLRGVVEFLDLAFGDAAAEQTDLRLDALLGSMAEVVAAVDAGQPATLSWRRPLGADEPDATALELVLVQPRLDHTSLSPAEDAIDALRQAARQAGIREEQGMSLRLTGEAVLQQEELQSVRGNALLAAAITTVCVTLLLMVGLGSWRLIVPVLVTLGVGLLLTAAGALLLIGRLNLISVTFAVLFIGLGVDFGIHLALRFREALGGGAAREQALAMAVRQVAAALTLSAVTAALGFVAFVPTDYQGLAELGLISAGGMAVALLTSFTLLPALLVLIGPHSAAGGEPMGFAAGPVINRPRIVLPLAVLLAAPSAVALPELRFDFDPLHLKDPDSESVRAFERLAGDPATSPYTIDVVADAGEAAALADRLRALPEVGSVVSLESFVPDEQAIKLEILDSLAFFLIPVLGPVDTDDLTPEVRRAAFDDLLALLDDEDVQAMPGGAALAAELRALAEGGLDERQLATLERALIGSLPALIDRLRAALEAGEVEMADLPQVLAGRWRTTDDQRRLLVRPARPITSNAELRAFADAVLAVEPTATGTPVVVREAGRAVLDAFETASWIALTTITFVLALVLRDLIDVLLVLVPLLLAVLYTAGSAVLLGLELNFANVIVLPLLLGLGVSGAIHVVLRARQEPAWSGVEHSSTPRAILFSALTTIASFGSLAVSDHLGLASMGQLLTIAILWSLVCTLIVLPNLLTLRAARSARS